MPTFIIVGGSHDGDRIDLPKTESLLRLAKRIPKRLLDRAEASHYRMESLPVEEYRLMGWPCSHKEACFFYVLQGMSDLEAMEMLLDGYRRSAPK